MESLHLNSEYEPDPESVEPEGSLKPEPEPEWLRRLRGQLPRFDVRIPWRPLRRLLLLGLLVLGAVLLWRGFQRSLRSVPPGWVGVCVNRFTGSVEILDPGTSLRPSALYQIHPIRISDQLLSGAPGQFNVTTKEGVLARVTVQARWAISRKSLLATWSALPPNPAEELVAPVLFASFRTAAPRYEVSRLISEQREELSAVAEREARLVSANPLLIPKTFADRLSDRVQVILTPSIGGESLTGEIFKRVANGQPALADPPAQPARVAVRGKAKKESTSQTQ